MRYGEQGHERPALVAPDGTLRDIAVLVGDINGSVLSSRVMQELRTTDVCALPMGTPAGVGMGQKPPIYLKPGDVVELGIEGLGKQRQRAVTQATTERT